MADYSDLSHDQALAREQKAAENKQEANLRAYEDAKRRLNDDAARERDDFIEAAYAAQDRAYKSSFDSKMSIEEDKLRRKEQLHKDAPVDSRIVTALDIPMKVSEGVARDLGLNLGRAQRKYVESVSGVLGVDGSIMGSDAVKNISTAIGTAGNVAEAVGQDIENIVTASPWLEKAARKFESMEKSPKKGEMLGFMDGIGNTSTTWMRSLILDLSDILNEWYHDPTTLCCFIKNMAAVAASMDEGQMFKKGRWNNLKKEHKDVFAGESGVSVTVAGPREFLDKLITILKIIRDFLKEELGYKVKMSIDLGFMMSKASISALMASLTALQAMIEDEVYRKIRRFAEKQISEEWRICLPFERFLRLLADFLTGPKGIFKYIEGFVDSFINDLSSSLNSGYNEAMKKTLMDVTALDRLIELLEAIRDALFNMELCIEANFTGDENISNNNISNEPSDAGERNTGIESRGGIAADVGRQARPVKDQVVFPTDNEVKAFIKNRMGKSEEFANQVIATSNKSENQTGSGGSNTNTGETGEKRSRFDNLATGIGDCSKTLNPDRAKELANLMSEWDIGF